MQVFTLKIALCTNLSFGATHKKKIWLAVLNKKKKFGFVTYFVEKGIYRSYCSDTRNAWDEEDHHPVRFVNKLSKRLVSIRGPSLQRTLYSALFFEALYNAEIFRVD